MRSILTLLLVALFAYGADRLLLYGGIARRNLLAFSDFLIGLVAAILVFITGQHHAQWDRFVAARLKIITEMNHHIRNALQVISFQARSSKNENEIRAMQDAVNRITWALNEVLPRMPGFNETSSDARQKTAAAKLHESKNKVSR